MLFVPFAPKSRENFLNFYVLDIMAIAIFRCFKSGDTVSASYGGINDIYFSENQI